MGTSKNHLLLLTPTLSTICKEGESGVFRSVLIIKEKVPTELITYTS